MYGLPQQPQQPPEILLLKEQETLLLHWDDVIDYMTAEKTAVINFSVHLIDTQNIKQQCMHLDNLTKPISTLSQGEKNSQFFPTMLHTI
jgi:superoxide dismutase